MKINVTEWLTEQQARMLKYKTESLMDCNLQKPSTVRWNQLREETPVAIVAPMEYSCGQLAKRMPHQNKI